MLSGGGARGAYQVGVLEGIREMGLLEPCPFQFYLGASAGAINVATLAAFADSPHLGLTRLSEMWASIRPHQVFRTDLFSLGKIALQWIRDLSFGGLLGGVGPKALLDTRPLIRLLEQLPYGQIGESLSHGHFRALGILATDYTSSKGVLFLQGAPDIELWKRVHLKVERATITPAHLRASAAIPIFFPSVELMGRHFGDGCIRNTAPLAPAIQLGADQVLAIGVREVPPEPTPTTRRNPPPTIATVAGVLLDAVLLDSVAMDAEHAKFINENLKGNTGKLRKVEVVEILPSRSIGNIVMEMEYLIPYPIRYLLRGLGSDEAAKELSSYLIFHPKFTKRLMEMGRQDAWANRERLQHFFTPRPQKAPRPATG